MVLEARGIAVPEDVRQRIVGATDLEELDRLLRRAVSVASAADLLGS